MTPAEESASPRPVEAFALVVRSPNGAHWQYISQAASFGNAMRTQSPFHARTWPTLVEVRDWAEGRCREVEDIERKFAERGDKLTSAVALTEYTIVSLTIAVGAPAGTLTLVSLEARNSSAVTDPRTPTP